ncbi:hypothetical protein CEXT_787461 [Caerostris extrusa]|uniref:Uncharacterized protein n=1 Tax=Caerostris extrusa TaxID=172846 RepID=A0AAV4VQ05_CAEEX|nr:hypothetical protein CEXT_787461 [Caerostris extrusa]
MKLKLKRDRRYRNRILPFGKPQKGVGCIKKKTSVSQGGQNHGTMNLTIRKAVRRTVIPSRRRRPRGNLHPGRFRDIEDETEIERGRRYPGRILPFGNPPKRRGLYKEKTSGKPRRTKSRDDEFDYPEAVRRTVIPSRRRRPRGKFASRKI